MLLNVYAEMLAAANSKLVWWAWYSSPWGRHLDSSACFVHAALTVGSGVCWH